MDVKRIVNGLVRAAKLDVSFYEEVEHDPSYSQDAIWAVVLVSVVAALGSFLQVLFGGRVGAAFGILIVAIASNLIAYFAWSYLVYFIGTRLFHGQAEYGEVQRTIGFAWGPRAVELFAFIPVLGAILGFVGWIWAIATGFVATRQSLDLDNTNAALTVIIAGVVAFLLNLLIGGAMRGLF